jgi:hypothetical protein
VENASQLPDGGRGVPAARKKNKKWGRNRKKKRDVKPDMVTPEPFAVAESTSGREALAASSIWSDANATLESPNARYPPPSQGRQSREFPERRQRHEFPQRRHEQFEYPVAIPRSPPQPHVTFATRSPPILEDEAYGRRLVERRPEREHSSHSAHQQMEDGRATPPLPYVQPWVFPGPFVNTPPYGGYSYAAARGAAPAHTGTHATTTHLEGTAIKSAIDTAKTNLFVTLTRSGNDKAPKTTALNLATAQRLVPADYQSQMMKASYDAITSDNQEMNRKALERLDRLLYNYCKHLLSYSKLLINYLQANPYVTSSICKSMQHATPRTMNAILSISNLRSTLSV